MMKLNLGIHSHESWFHFQILTVSTPDDIVETVYIAYYWDSTGGKTPFITWKKRKQMTNCKWSDTEGNLIVIPDHVCISCCCEKIKKTTSNSSNEVAILKKNNINQVEWET